MPPRRSAVAGSMCERAVRCTVSVCADAPTGLGWRRYISKSICIDDIIVCMPSILIQLDDATYKALNQIAPAAKRKRTEFIRQAVKEAIRKQEYERIREAYRKQPDSAAGGDDWSNCEKFEASASLKSL